MGIIYAAVYGATMSPSPTRERLNLVDVHSRAVLLRWPVLWALSVRSGTAYANARLFIEVEKGLKRLRVETPPPSGSILNGPNRMKKAIHSFAAHFHSDTLRP